MIEVIHANLPDCDGISQCGPQCPYRVRAAADPAARAQYLRGLIAERGAPARTTRRQAFLPPGAGARLKEQLGKLGLPPCGECAALAAQMDAGGPAWCRSNRAHIVASMLKRAREMGALADIEKLGGTEADVAEFIGNLVDEAIAFAEEGLLDILQVESVSGGRGDQFVTVAMAGGLQNALPNTRVIYVCQPWAVPWVSLFWPEENISTERLPAPCLLCNTNPPAWDEFTGRGQSRWEYWQEQYHVRAAMPACRVESVADAIPFAGRVLLAPFAAFAERTWPLENWMEIERRLLDAGFFCAILHSGEDARLDGFHSGKLLGRSPAFVASVMRYAVAVAGNDSGMAHLAGALGMPAVAVCSEASDKNIMGLWPTVASIGNDGQPATVDQVYEAIVRQAQPRGDFPIERFLATLMPQDEWRRHCWPPIYAALWRTVEELAPQTVVEIGVRAGQGAWTILDAAPGAHLTGYDVEELDASRDMAVPGATTHARAILPRHDAEIIAADSRTLERIPPCDLCYVDGDHTESGCYADLCLAERSGAKAMLVDDCAYLEGVRRAVARFLAENPHRRARFIPSQTGLYLIES